MMVGDCTYLFVNSSESRRRGVLVAGNPLALAQFDNILDTTR